MTICAWCGRVLRPEKPAFVTHGMCPTCQVAFLGGPGPVSLREFIGRFDFPVIVVGPDAELIEANSGALRLVDKERREVRGQLAARCWSASTPRSLAAAASRSTARPAPSAIR